MRVSVLITANTCFISCPLNRGSGEEGNKMSRRSVERRHGGRNVGSEARGVGFKKQFLQELDKEVCSV